MMLNAVFEKRFLKYNDITGYKTPKFKSGLERSSLHFSKGP